MTDAAAAPDAWRRFAEAPTLGCHPAHVVAAFDGAIPAETASDLAGRPDFAARLSALVARRAGFEDAVPPFDPADRAIALSSAAELAELAKRAGAVCWADLIAREIRAAEVAALRETLGEETYRAALDHRDEALSPAALGLGPEPAPEGEAIIRNVRAASRACLAGWLATQSQGVADRVRLKLDPAEGEAEIDDVFAEAGPRILRRLAA